MEKEDNGLAKRYSYNLLSTGCGRVTATKFSSLLLPDNSFGRGMNGKGKKGRSRGLQEKSPAAIGKNPEDDKNMSYGNALSRSTVAQKPFRHSLSWWTEVLPHLPF